MFKGLVTTAVVTFGTLLPAQALWAASVELGLAIDGSSSISGTQFTLQRNAYVNIFSNNFAENFLSGDVDTLYVSFWQFASTVREEVSWTTIKNNTEAQNFANLISVVTQIGGGTATGLAIDTIANSILTNGLNGDSKVIDISTDGLPNNQTQAINAATNAFSNGITVNTLFVGTSTLGRTQNAAVAAAGGGIAFTANSFDEYEAALFEKLQVEIGGGPSQPVPEPTSLMAILGLAIVGAGSKFKAQKPLK